LLGHLIRSSPENLQRKVAFDSKLVRPHQLYKKTGHPRTSWVEDNLERAYLKQFPLEPFDIKNQENLNKFIQKTKDYEF
jgi:hypothetical protein